MLVAIEGIDGSGKGTQAKLLKNRLLRRGVSASVMSFPQYQCTISGAVIGQYLNGVYGDLHPKIAAMLFAMDRAESVPLLAAIQSVDDVVIFDRWVASNIAHQFVRLPGGSQENELPSFATWVQNLEYESLRIPQADMTIWLETPVSVAVENIREKKARVYTDKVYDMHESDVQKLEEARLVYQYLAIQNQWDTIFTSSVNFAQRFEDDIADQIEKLVMERLARPREVDYAEIAKRVMAERWKFATEDIRRSAVNDCKTAVRAYLAQVGKSTVKS